MSTRFWNVLHLEVLDASADVKFEIDARDKQCTTARPHSGGDCSAKKTYSPDIFDFEPQAATQWQTDGLKNS